MAPEESYRTVSDRGETRFEIRGSEFIGRAAPVRSVEEAEAFIAEITDEHPDASHTVPAYRVRSGEGILREWSSDDGEPSGSAGKPVLNVLERRAIENVVVVVTRYFGGTELGVGGLARAYARGANDAIDAAGMVDREPHVESEITVEYDDSGTVRGLIESAGYDFTAEYDEDVRFTVLAPVTESDELLNRVRSATSGRATIDR